MQLRNLIRCLIMIKSLINGVDMSLSSITTRIISSTLRITSLGLMICLLSNCSHPPYNNFQPEHRVAKNAATGALMGSTTGLIVSSTLTGTVIGAAIGGTIGAAHGLYKDSKPGLVKQLRKQSIQFEEYGDTMTLIIPTDKYFIFMSPRLNEVCAPGLMNIVRLLKLYPQSPIYIAAFTDNVGSTRQKKLMSQAQAEAMMTYLWANGIRSIQLKPEGYGDKNDIADNSVIHGSADNRRIEIQWFTGLVAKAEQPVFDMK